jgi:hypothetical protein
MSWPSCLSYQGMNCLAQCYVIYILHNM